MEALSDTDFVEHVAVIALLEGDDRPRFEYVTKVSKDASLPPEPARVVIDEPGDVVRVADEVRKAVGVPFLVTLRHFDDEIDLEFQRLFKGDEQLLPTGAEKYLLYDLSWAGEIALRKFTRMCVFAVDNCKGLTGLDLADFPATLKDIQVDDCLEQMRDPDPATLPGVKYTRNPPRSNGVLPPKSTASRSLPAS